MNQNLNIRKAMFIFVIITSFTVMSTNIISYIDFDRHYIEFLGDFDSKGSLEYDETDFSEDLDSTRTQEEPGFVNTARILFSDQYLFFDHYIPGIVSPPPELA